MQRDDICWQIFSREERKVLIGGVKCRDYSAVVVSEWKFSWALGVIIWEGL